MPETKPLRVTVRIRQTGRIVLHFDEPITATEKAQLKKELGALADLPTTTDKESNASTKA